MPDFSEGCYLTECSVDLDRNVNERSMFVSRLELNKQIEGAPDGLYTSQYLTGKMHDPD